MKISITVTEFIPPKCEEKIERTIVFDRNEWIGMGANATKLIDSALEKIRLHAGLVADSTTDRDVRSAIQSAILDAILQSSVVNGVVAKVQEELRTRMARSG